MKKKVRYRYALNESKTLTTIEEAMKDCGKYHCLKCGLEMIPRQGDNNAWHFAHKGKECNYDYYLHTLAELKIQKWYNEAKKINILVPYKAVCPNSNSCVFNKPGYGCDKELTKIVNLKDYWIICDKEVTYYKDGKKFVADLLCKNRNGDNNPLFLEICVTHPCENDKINSGIRIIEFVIEGEDDIERLLNNTIEQSCKVRYYNFNSKNEIAHRNEFGMILNKVVIGQNFKAGVNPISCKDLGNRRGIFEMSIERSQDIQNFYEVGGMLGVAQAIALKYIPNYKSCYLCKYHHHSNYGYICSCYKKYGTQKYCKDNNSVTCPYYTLDETLIERRIAAFERARNNTAVDVYIKK